MRKKKVYLTFWSLLLLLMVFSFSLGQQQRQQQRQRRQRTPWNERSPAVGKKVPEFMVYDKDLKKIPLSNLYKDTLLVVQWGGCT